MCDDFRDPPSDGPSSQQGHPREYSIDGFTLTKHYHIRNYGQIRLNAQGRWQLTNRADDLQWKVAAELSRYPTRTRNSHTSPVTRVFNLVLDPPGNVVILTPSHKVHISASLGYHTRYEFSPGDRLQRTGGMPVYTQRDALQLSFPAQNGECFENVRDKSHSLDDLPYPTPTGGNRVCITKKGDLPLRCDVKDVY